MATVANLVPGIAVGLLIASMLAVGAHQMQLVLARDAISEAVPLLLLAAGAGLALFVGLTRTNFEDRGGVADDISHAPQPSAVLVRVLREMPQPVCLRNGNGEYLFANQAFADLHGLMQGEVNAGRISRMFPRTGPDEYRRLDAEALATGASQGEIRFVNAVGQPRHVLYSNTRCYGDDGEALVIGVATDLTGERQAQALTRQALQRFDQVIQCTPLVAIQSVDRKGVVREWNSASSALYDIPREQAIGRQLGELVLRPEHRRQLDDALERLFRTGEPAVLSEWRLDPPNGRKLWVYSTMLPVTIDGEVMEVFMMDVDITAHKHVESRLRQSEARWQFALDGAGDGVWDWDARTNSLFYSKRCLEMLGMGSTDRSAPYESWMQRVHPQDAAGVHEAMVRQLKGLTRTFATEHRLRREDGEYIWVHLRGKVVERDALGRALRVIGTLADVSERRAIDEELRHHREHLQELVAAQTAEALRARDEAQRANNVKSEFLANMSHELRTPMHGVLSFARLGSTRVSKMGDEKLQAYFARILESGGRLLMLLDDLLDLSKFEAGKMRLDFRPHSMVELIERTLSEFEAIFAARRLVVELDAQDGLPLVSLDAGHFVRLLSNLVSNAVKFSPEASELQIHVSACLLPAVPTDAGEEGMLAGVEVVVADQGIGIPQAELETIFDKFVQSSKTRTGAGGTGLGLAICKEIVEAHRGIIFARNNDSGGTDFIARFPVGVSLEST